MLPKDELPARRQRDPHVPHSALDQIRRQRAQDLHTDHAVQALVGALPALVPAPPVLQPSLDTALGWVDDILGRDAQFLSFAAKVFLESLVRLQRYDLGDAREVIVLQLGAAAGADLEDGAVRVSEERRDADGGFEGGTTWRYRGLVIYGSLCT